MHYYHFPNIDVPAQLLFPTVEAARNYSDGVIDGLMSAFEALGLDDPDHCDMLAGLILEVEEDLEIEIKAIERHN